MDEAVEVNVFIFRIIATETSTVSYKKSIYSILTQEALNNCRRCLMDADKVQSSLIIQYFCHSPVDAVDFY